MHVQCIQELCEEAFIESCFEELFEEEDRFAEELEQFLSSLTQEQVGSLVNQLDAVSLSDNSNCSQQPATSHDTDEVFTVSLIDSLSHTYVCRFKVQTVLLHFLFVRSHQRMYDFIAQPSGIGGIGAGIGFSIGDTDTTLIPLVSADT